MQRMACAEAMLFAGALRQDVEGEPTGVRRSFRKTLFHAAECLFHGMKKAGLFRDTGSTTRIVTNFITKL